MTAEIATTLTLAAIILIILGIVNWRIPVVAVVVFFVASILAFFIEVFWRWMGLQ